MEPPAELLQPERHLPAPVQTFSFLSPRRFPLPNDVVREIFKPFSAHLLIHEWDVFPWFLGHICSEWRYIFISMKLEFWSNIEIDWKKFEKTPKFYKPWQNRFKALVDLFLERSAAISFRFCLPSSRFDDFMPEDLELAVNAFINESHRWRDVFLQISPSAAQALLPVRNRVPLLRNLEIYVAERRDDSLLNIFSNAPSLISVTVKDVSEWRFDWSALTTFCLQYGGRFDGFLSTLPQMTRLEKLIVFVNESGGRPDKKIKLPSLKCLRTSGTGLLTVLEVDVLEELSISFNNDVPETIDPSLLRRSTRNVLRLRVRGIATQALIDIVQCTPHLVHLTLDSPQDLISTLDWLARGGGERAGQECPIPHLQALSIFPAFHIVNGEILEAICTLVATRGKRTSVNGGKSLRSLQIRYISIIGEKGRLVLKKVKTLCEELGVMFSTGGF